MKELGGGGRSAPRGSPPEFGQALGDPLPLRLAVVVPDQSQTQNLPMFRFRGAPMLGRPDAQAADDVVIEVANRKRRHDEPLCCHTLH
jgi:hypothetical protein